ncbi:MAG: peptide deformylase [Candidatus Atribacteria bacterium]|jgi:peptide deformylase|nr:peptide deformylase [Candidatus Atribacteria bacterium]
MVRKIVLYGNPLLREKAQPVTSIDGRIVSILQDMEETMLASSGIGLAGNQIGVLLRLVTLVHPEQQKVLHLINPEIVEKSGDGELQEEGCLSLPGLYAKVERAEKTFVKALDINGKEIQIAAEGLLARILQHEIDHLNGTLFIDRLAPARRLLINGKLKQIARREKEEP